MKYCKERPCVTNPRGIYRSRGLYFKPEVGVICPSTSTQCEGAGKLHHRGLKYTREGSVNTRGCVSRVVPCVFARGRGFVSCNLLNTHETQNDFTNFRDPARSITLTLSEPNPAKKKRSTLSTVHTLSLFEENDGCEATRPPPSDISSSYRRQRRHKAYLMPSLCI